VILRRGIVSSFDHGGHPYINRHDWLGTTWGPKRLDVLVEQVSGFVNRSEIRVKVSLRGGDGPVAGDALQDVQQDAGIGKPGQARVS